MSFSPSRTSERPAAAHEHNRRGEDEDGLLTVAGQRRLYAKRASSYDAATKLFHLVGIPLERYRRWAVDVLSLSPGSVVVELGCGTGANFPLLEERVGTSGRVIGVDVTPEMLDRARARVVKEGWGNVTLVEGDMADYVAPDRVDAVLSTFALMLSPRQEEVFRHVAAMLRPGGRVVVLDFKEPPWPEWLIRAYLPLVRPYGATREMADRHPWEIMSRTFGNCLLQERYGGGVFLASSEAS